ncbi:MAG: LacI family transcriptional regulator [Oscillospiraceae bacterium]|jgi:DNA-binding LacI/PurR family transcriptional regulator|nr:LacI family transcriptional regulator [Oscillospiraceae bacterium]MCI1991480.1 LacI family transcriptional regulator [Oscillospiraceae bacterium]MCI2035308.1 LacI family transcriptional regulator [Oscillospiraceae bacterium]
MAVTIKDVAREANVSPSTVSKVMNHSPSIPERTVKHVQEVMERLHYFPNLQARNFVRKTTRNIAFVTRLEPHIAFANPHMFDILCGVQEVLARKDYNLSIVGIHDLSESMATVERIIAQKSADGIVVHGSATTRDLTNLLIESKFPHILIGKPNFESQVCWIDTNNFISGQIAARHLCECGFKKIAFLGGTREDKIFTQRLNGFLSVMAEKGLNVPDEFIQYGDTSSECSFGLMNKLLACSVRPDAVICEDNTVAFGAIRSIHQHSLKMPEDIALICFDNYPLSEIMDPMPTVVDINVNDMGMQAATLLLRKIKNPELQVQTFTTLPVLKIRSSTRPCGTASAAPGKKPAKNI